MLFVSLVIVSEFNGFIFLDVDNVFVFVCISLFGGYILLYVFKSDGRECFWVSFYVYLNGEWFICGGILVCWFWFSDDYGWEKGVFFVYGFLRI